LFFGFFLIISAFHSAEKSEPEQLLTGKQDFESPFEIVNSPEEFLPGWTGNDIRSTASRIFQSGNLGRSGGKALAVQPISTFNGELIVRLSPENQFNPKVQFWAKSVQNGTGTRPAQVFYSWSESIDRDFSAPKSVGEVDEFGNENQEFRKFQIAWPQEFENSDQIFLRMEIRYGPGTGSCARWIMDDFEFGEIIEDTVPPTIVSVKGFDERELLVQFSESVDPVFSQFLLNYKLEGVEPEKVELKADSLVRLTFNQPLEKGKEYGLQVSGIPDLEGNFLRDTIINFQFFDPTTIPPKGLVINEIMSAPKADLDLPNVEYVELFHAGEYDYRLENLRWSNSRSEVVLNDYWIKPGEYVLLVPENQAALMQEFGKVIPIKNWPTLLNSADQIILRDDTGFIIDQIEYSTSSWGGAEFSGGGYSLEVVNPFYACDQSDLLQSSKDPLLGTPGKSNSVLDLGEDVLAPEFISWRFITPTQLELTFSETIFPDFSIGNFTFQPAVLVESVVSDRSKIILKVKLEENLEYQLTFSGLRDCYGNSAQSLEPVIIVLPSQAKIGDLVINELLFNPRTGDPKFIELQNLTEKYLEIGNWKFGNLDENGKIDQVRIISELGLVISPRGYLAITTDSERLKLAYPRSFSGLFREVSSLPSYPISGGTVVLLNENDQIVEAFGYDEDLHHPLLRDSKGVSLERISAESPASLLSNWHSASGIEEYATPGRKNSQVISGEFEGEMIVIEPGVFDPEGSNGNTFTTIKYQLDKAGWIGSFRIYNLAGQLIQILAQNEILGANGLFSWTGTDSQGGKVRPGYYVLVVELYDLSGEVIVIQKTIVVATRL
jgi:hypothetical protein